MGTRILRQNVLTLSLEHPNQIPESDYLNYLRSLPATIDLFPKYPPYLQIRDDFVQLVHR
jgi:hypothetical protein